MNRRRRTGTGETPALARHRLKSTPLLPLLAKAFRGELVAQDPADEPAAVLLNRLRAERG
jgi:type I restriction enzyme, S subunit